ncbi:MAG: ABC transporter permease [Puniceicoccales bacterium]|nr:ABC transporter permease [Puniceicoccales bacterium]
MKYSFQHTSHHFFQNPWVLCNVTCLCGIVGLCLLGPYFYTHDYHSQNLLMSAQLPSLNHWFGTDILGRDLLARILYGGRTSLFIGCAASLIAISIGLIYGIISGYCGGNVDRLLMRIVDILYPLPFTLLVILLMALLGRNITLLIFSIGCIKWLTMARMVRTQILSLKVHPFVQCARCMGQSTLGIWRKHLLPNLMSTVIVYGTLLMPNIILEEAFISFLGLGIQPPLSSWGILIFDGARHMEEHPWLLIFPCLFFSSTLFTLNFLGDALRDAMDPVHCRYK